MDYLGRLPESKPEVRVAFEKGHVAMQSYRWDEAIALFGEAMSRAVRTELVALYGLVGRCHHMPGRLQQALESYEESARLAEQFGDKQGQAAALDRAGVILRDMGRHGEVLAKYEAALGLAREAGASVEQASVLANIGAHHYVNGQPAEALRYFEAALSLHRRAGNREGEATVLCNIGLANSEDGRQDLAIESCEQALVVAREIGAKRVEASALANLGFLYWDKTNVGRTLEYDGAAVRLYREIGDKRGEAGALANLGAVLLESGEPEKAVASFLSAQNAFSVAGTIAGPERYRHGLGRCLEALGRDKFVEACANAGLAKPESEKLADELKQAGK